MKRIIVLLVISVPLLMLNAFMPDKHTIIGVWKAPDMENSTIEVYKAQDGYIYGKIIDSDEQSWRDKIILQKVQYDAKDKVWKGEVYSLRMDTTVDVVITLESASKLKLVGTKFLMSKTFYWTK